MAEQARIDRNYERGHAIGEAIGEGAVNLVSAGWSHHRERKQARLDEEERQRRLESQRQQLEEQEAERERQRLAERESARRKRHELWEMTREGRALLAWADRREQVAQRMQLEQDRWDWAWRMTIREHEDEARVSRRPELVWGFARLLAWLAPYVLVLGIVLFVLSWFSPGMKFIHRLLWLAFMVFGGPIIVGMIGDAVRSKADRVPEELDAREGANLRALLDDRYGFDPRGTLPWLGPVTVQKLRRQTEAVLAQADVQGHLRYGPPVLEPLYVRTPDERWPGRVRDVLTEMASQTEWGFRPAPVRPPASEPAPQTGPDPEARERAQVGRWEYLIEVMAHLERAWAPAVAEAEKEAPDGHTSSTLTGRYGLDPRSTRPWVEDLTADDVEDALETAAAAGPVGPPPGLTLREHTESWPEAVGEVLSMAEEALWDTERPSL
ncbi:hypothetical protein GZ998_05555 [Actinomyces sp. 594]|uniref:hypothetical protein n=1 Tax=Actinomyces sp. 594 TaxID=2057793 RepID=UPI001C582777|nr:hypothetical protein [Actinomyces sp. 594]MBW3068979.1 hypothetical protein [Actinomyces sp. 594]